jgi:hypothetical protein
MRKGLIKFIYITCLTLSAFTIHKAFAARSPSVEPFVEVDIENPNNNSKKASGFDFNEKEKTNKRYPAAITTKTTTSPYSYLGPIIFLIALPFAIWMVISKKVDEPKIEDKVDYYSKTFQFNPYKTEYQKNDDNDDIDFPKAS